MSSGLKTMGDFAPANDPDQQGYVALGTSGYWAAADTLQSEAEFYRGVMALRDLVSPLAFTAEFLQDQKEQFIRQTKARIDPAELSEQLNAIFGMLDRGQLLSVITGPPGAAKSTIASLWARVVRGKYHDMPILVLTQEVTALQRLQDKIGLPHTTAWLMGEALNKTAPWPRGAAIIVDEAGLFSTETLARLLKRVQEIGAVKVILIGDDKQLVSEAPGQPFRWLCERDETDAVILQHSFRQKNLWLRQAVQALYQGDAAEALRLIPCHFIDKETMQPAIDAALSEAVPENTLLVVHGDCDLSSSLRMLSLAEAQGLAIDRVVLVIVQEINLAELLVGCSRQRHDLDLFIDIAVYSDAAELAATIKPYPKNLMALDVVSPDTLLTLV